jgi:hypothetical protein
MSPTWAGKTSKRWRYYVSQAALQGDKSKAGSILRVPAADVETLGDARQLSYPSAEGRLAKAGRAAIVR